MCKKRKPTNQPKWLDPSTSSKTSSTGPNNQSSNSSGPKDQDTRYSTTCVESLTFSPEWTLIKAGGNFYAEYHDSNCPEELDPGCDGTLLFKFILICF
jgi:hypothetical protein